MISKITSKYVFLAGIFLAITSCKVEPSKSVENAHTDQHETMENWEDHKFSMFIHWGLYAIPAGVWDGQEISGYSEQIKGHAKIPTEDYRKLAAEFDPIHWDADAVAILAIKAGMKCIVLTSKHHDGFCLFDSKYTKFDVVDATPYKKDIVKELAEACKRHDLKFGVYFSLIDWDYEGALPFENVNNSDVIPDLHHQYNLNQVEELLSNYGDISEIWFDMGAPTYAQSKDIATLVKRLQPNCMISGRLWNDQGDFVVMGDNKQPDFKMGVPWQTPASMFDETWSYRSWQKRPPVADKIGEKIHDLLKVVSSGGNYLLNIGPTGDGTVIPFETQVLEGIGAWLEKNGESIYGSKAVSLQEQEWGVLTMKPGKIYLHIMDYPADDKIVIKGLSGVIKKAYPLADNSITLKSKASPLGLEIDLTNKIIKDKYATTLVLEYEGELSVAPLHVIAPNTNNKFILTADNAEKYHSYSGHDYYSSKATVIQMKWYLGSPTKENSELKITWNSHENNEFNLTINDQEYSLSALSSDQQQSKDSYELKLTQINLNQEKINEITLRLADQSNPHKDMAIESLEISVD